MLLVLANWLLASALCLTYGTALLGLFAKDKAPIFLLWPLLAGMIALTGLTGIWVLFQPVNAVWLGLLLCGGAGLFLIQRRRINETLTNSTAYFSALPLPLKGLSFIYLLLTLAHQAIPPVHYDEGLYYLQTIKWFNEYGTVPGLGNMHTRLAFDSNWHLLASLWSLPILSLGTLDDVNGLLVCWFLLLPFRAAARAWRGTDLTPGDKLSLLLTLFLFVFYTAHAAPAADLAVALLLWAMAYLWLEEEKSAGQILLLWLLGGFLLTVKPSVAPAVGLLLALPFVVKRWRIHFFGALGCLVLLALWMTRNVIFSGYLLYPLPAADLFNFDWEIPRSIALQELCSIKAWAKLPGRDCTIVNAMPLKEWLPQWFAARKPYDKALLLVLPALMLFALTKLALQFRRFSAEWLLLCGMTFGGCLFWFVQAPDPRFGYGFLAMAFGLAVLTLLPKTVNISKKLPFLALAISLALWASIFALFIPGAKTAWHYPLIPAQAEANHALHTNTPLLRSSPTDQCWDSPLPCTPFPESRIRMRGKELKDGFQPVGR